MLYDVFTLSQALVTWSKALTHGRHKSYSVHLHVMRASWPEIFSAQLLVLLVFIYTLHMHCQNCWNDDVSYAFQSFPCQAGFSLWFWCGELIGTTLVLAPFGPR
jgi:hypothetical protein